MAELVACPTCRAMLRVPPDVPMIRCPQCKTILAVNAPTAPPLPFGPVSLPPPPPPLEPKPIPIFVDNSPALPAVAEKSPVEPLPQTMPIATGRPRSLKLPKKAQISHEEPGVYDPNEERESKRPIAWEDRPYEDLDESEKRQRRKFDKLNAECRPGQTGMQILFWAYRIGAFGYFCMAAAGLMLTIGGAVGTITYLIAGLNGLFALVSTLGLAYCCAGPRGMRGSAAVGTFVGLVSCVLSPLSVPMTAQAFKYEPLNPPELYDSRGEAAVAHYASLGPVHMLPQLPGFTLANKNIPWLALFAGVMELLRNFFVCGIARHYAEEGKDPDLGYRASRYLFRLTVIMVVITVLATMGWVVEQRGWFLGSQRYDYLFLAVTINLGVDTLLVSVAAQSQALMDIAEITDARRFIDKNDRLDTV